MDVCMCFTEMLWMWFEQFHWWYILYKMRRKRKKNTFKNENSIKKNSLQIICFVLHISRSITLNVFFRHGEWALFLVAPFEFQFRCYAFCAVWDRKREKKKKKKELKLIQIFLTYRPIFAWAKLFNFLLFPFSSFFFASISFSLRHCSITRSRRKETWFVFLYQFKRKYFFLLFLVKMKL